MWTTDNFGANFGNCVDSFPIFAIVLYCPNESIVSDWERGFLYLQLINSKKICIQFLINTNTIHFKVVFTIFSHDT